ncbi:putative integral membrane protein [Babesia bovis T2Bo]|uniref:Amino acid transporter transmembrane domain-containing protein n=1 Tax=Babesia bovis TaxID=5865 RepID=A7AW67_BABBO|nr:putative integral membrane protein [Babesia bovis T2Bo]EDO05295.1 putative integral membrane protein [Babesia bovis T2Bo]|eukprot:XP_001608863.1 hypothetical protein [Babesia bovis T2Bo]
MELHHASDSNAIPGVAPSGFVRSRKRFKAYTWSYKKTITPIASFFLVVNQMIGIGMSDIPSVMRDGGWIPALIANLLISIVAALCSLMLLRAMTLIPHNENFGHRIEYSALVKYYLSDYNFRLVSILNHVGNLCSVISGILAFSKLVDLLLVKAFGWTLAFQVHPFVFIGRADLDVVTGIYESGSYHGEGVHSMRLAITLGYVICALVCLRLSSCALEETMGFHVFSFFAFIGCGMQMAIFGLTRSLRVGAAKRPPALGNLRFVKLLLTFVENFSVASSTPSWANEMTNDVKVSRTMWTSTLFTAIVYHVLGYIFCFAFPDNSGDIVSDILLSNTGVLAHAALCLFVAVNVLPDVVFGTISTKYNLLNLGYCNRGAAYFWGCVLPFTFSWLLSNESYFIDYLGHIGLISALFCDFVVPVIVYKVATAGFADLSTSAHGSLQRQKSFILDDNNNSALFKRGTSLLFKNMSTFGRAFTCDYINRGQSNDQSTIVPLEDGGSFLDRYDMPVDENGKPIDYATFKIIRPPLTPREDDHLYNVISMKKRKSRVSFDFPDDDDFEDDVQCSTSSLDAERDVPQKRVELFPFVSLERHSGLLTQFILATLATFAVVPMFLNFWL